MTDSAPAPQRVDVERFTPTIIYAGESPTGWFGDVEANANGEYVRHSEYAALLQQVAAQAAEIETRREDYATLAAMWKDDEAKYRARAEAAERAREEFAHTAPLLLDARASYRYPTPP